MGQAQNRLLKAARTTRARHRHRQRWCRHHARRPAQSGARSKGSRANPWEDCRLKVRLRSCLRSCQRAWRRLVTHARAALRLPLGRAGSRAAHGEMFPARSPHPPARCPPTSAANIPSQRAALLVSSSWDEHMVAHTVRPADVGGVLRHAHRRRISYRSRCGGACTDPPPHIHTLLATLSCCHTSHCTSLLAAPPPPCPDRPKSGRC